MARLLESIAGGWAVGGARVIACAFLLCAAACTTNSATNGPSVSAPVDQSAPQPANRPSGRAKPGPVRIRGRAHHLSSAGFTVHTAKHGDYAVVLLRVTTVKNKQGDTDLHEGDDVGVRGLLEGRQLRAMAVTVYSVTSPPYSVKGTIAAAGDSALTLRVATRSLHVALTGDTTVQLPNGAGTLGDLLAGQRVAMRLHNVAGTPTAIRIHVYKGKTSGPAIEVIGTMVALSATSVTVTSGTEQVSAAMTGQTAIYLGTDRAAPGALHPGQSVRLYACCSGAPLVVRSIHIRRAVVHHTIVTLHGHVQARSGDWLSLSTGAGATSVRTGSATVYRLGSVVAAAGDVRVGDEVSIHGYRASGAFQATRVFISAAARRPHTIRGTVLTVGSEGIEVLTGATRYSVVPASNAAITLGNRSIPFDAVAVGEKVRATGVLRGHTVQATRILVTPAPVKKGHAHGVLASIDGNLLVITDSNGSSHAARLAPGARITLHGQTAPPGALFPGVQVTARGTISGGTLLVTTLTLAVTERTVKGRLGRVSPSSLQVHRSSRLITVTVPAGVGAVDGSRTLSAADLHAGAFVQVRGYEPSKGTLRAISIHVLHPSLDIRGVMGLGGAGASVQTSTGEVYALTLSSTSLISAERSRIDLQAGDIPPGARVHVQGKMRSDGSLGVTSLVVRLTSLSLRARVVGVGVNELTLGGVAPTEVRVTTSTSLLQGSRSLLLSDLVVGDDVTVSGYRLGTGTILARKITVHRRVVGLDGVILSVSAEGFILVTPIGNVQVRTGDTTALTGSPPVSGVTAHVTGYLRGDGVVLATRVRTGKKRADAAMRSGGPGKRLSRGRGAVQLPS